jgi:hypothetical protein
MILRSYERGKHLKKRRVHDHARTNSAHVSEARDHGQAASYGAYLNIQGDHQPAASGRTQPDALHC